MSDRHQAPPATLGPGAIAETLLLPIATLWLGHIIAPTHPYTAGGFPWMWLVPLLIGLRYGTGSALVSSGLLTAGGNWLPSLGYGSEVMPLPQIVGGMIISLIGGQYANLWHGRLKQAEGRLTYSETRLESLTRAFYVTRISHDRLEETLITRPVSLRGAMETLRAHLQHHGAQLHREAGDALLQLLAQYCRIEAAAVYVFEGGHLNTTPIAHLGRDIPLNLDDPLVSMALQWKDAAYFSVDQIINDLAGDYRLVIPIIAADHGHIGLLTVSDMPFLALEEENLLTATAILEYFADDAWAQRDIVEILRHYPHCPATFAHELFKLAHLWSRVGAQSVLVLFRPTPGANPEILELIHSVRRGLDQYWQNPITMEAPGLLVLLPLSGPAAARGFIARIDTLTVERFRMPLQDTGWYTEITVLHDVDPVATLRATLPGKATNA